jgi:hypothetical protein
MRPLRYRLRTLMLAVAAIALAIPLVQNVLRYIEVMYSLDVGGLAR